ncbi:hypothetical protein [Hymenobacter ruricola]|uniref:Uncharacterized protein n=1 Tax=Hymenobacter ruricola TaxID=2791023 RepID=A0ABS0I1X9_9BACT|nr:hypothetical protein [Hymenobacter ruricola]MBF9220945.1 hypothetical protein [Hymenobacter ruricola]
MITQPQSFPEKIFCSGRTAGSFCTDWEAKVLRLLMKILSGAKLTGFWENGLQRFLKSGRSILSFGY